jgi:glucuronosyltransferase
MDLIHDVGNSMPPIKTLIKFLPGIRTLTAFCENIVSNKALLGKLKSMNFDLVVIDITLNECSLAFANQLNIPIVGIWSFRWNTAGALMTTASIPPSHVPGMQTSFTDKMTFPQRLFNFVYFLCVHVAIRAQCILANYFVQKHIPGSPSPATLLQELNGMLINLDDILDYPQLLPPTFIRVGGLHIRGVEKFSKDLEDWIESSGDHGVILFSIGHMLNPSVLPVNFIKAFFKAASKLPQKFIMKLEGDFGKVPDNIKILKRLPQQSILAHNKTKLFISHCGQHGIIESIHFEVPIIAMPLFLDQSDNLIRLLEYGVAIELNRHTENDEEIFQTLRYGLEDPTIKNNIKELSRRIKDVPESPHKRALNLVEYLIRNNGAPHLKMASRHLNTFQYFSIDVILFFGAVIYIIYYLVKRILKLLVFRESNYQVSLEVKKIL